MTNEIKSLPPLPASIVRIQELCMSSDTDIDELARVIEADPMLSANILKSVNSPLYGMSKEISSIPQAVMLFGISMIRGFAAANAIKKTVPVDLSPYGKTIDDLGRISTLQTTLVREWYRNVDKSMLPLLQSAAFLMELGKLVASIKIISSGAAERFKEALAEGKAITETEREILGLSSYDIASMMFEHWNFESALTEVLKEISDISTLNRYAQALRVVSDAVDFSDALTPEGIQKALVTIGTFGLNRAAFEEAVQTVQANCR